jgi:hypothetical protein
MIAPFFPPDSLGARPDLHGFVAGWFASYLIALEERPLYPPPAEIGPTFRCLCLPTWDRPSAVRIERRALTWWLTGQQADGDGGFEIGRVDRRVARLLSNTEAIRVADLLPLLRFWELPPFIDDTGCDGTTWVLEGVDGGRYHVAHRWCPGRGDPFGDFGRLLLEFCRFGDGGSWGVA